MEKLIYILWKHPSSTAESFHRELLSVTAPTILSAGAQKIRMMLNDAAVASAKKLQIHSSISQLTPPDALVSFWLNSASDRHDIQAHLALACTRLYGYVVSESEPLLNTRYATAAGERSPGMNQVVLLRKPERLTREQWLDIWLNSHTQIAIDTQSTFGYRQNIVVRSLTPDAAPIDAIVEENFPADAMTSGQAFYNAVGNEALYKENQGKMFASVQRFIDFDKLDCLPMSEYYFV